MNQDSLSGVGQLLRAIVGEPGMTPWFSGRVQPVQIGVYQRRNTLGRLVYSYFDGATWYWNQHSASLAAREREPSLAQALEWRGLSQPPAEGYGPDSTLTPEASC